MKNHDYVFQSRKTQWNLVNVRSVSKTTDTKQAKRLMQAIKTTRALVATESQRLKSLNSATLIFLPLLPRLHVAGSWRAESAVVTTLGSRRGPRQAMNKGSDISIEHEGCLTEGFLFWKCGGYV